MPIIKNKGFSLVELIVAMAIISITVVAMLELFKVNIVNSADPMIRKQLISVSESLMEEVLSKDFTKQVDGYSGALTAANRSSFDTVTDYNGLSISPIKGINGATLSSLSGYSAAIAVEPAVLGSLVSSDTYMVTITVNGPASKIFVLRGFRVNYE